MNLLTFMLRSLKAERCDFGGKNRPDAGTLQNKVSTLVLLLERTVNGQGSRLTFQLASPVASDRFDSLAKTNFSVARHLNIYYHIKSSEC